jgi:hypothetical protein
VLTMVYLTKTNKFSPNKSNEIDSTYKDLPGTNINSIDKEIKILQHWQDYTLARESFLKKKDRYS